MVSIVVGIIEQKIKTKTAPGMREERYGKGTHMVFGAEEAART
jgi:hypothetical protein